MAIQLPALQARGLRFKAPTQGNALTNALRAEQITDLRTKRTSRETVKRDLPAAAGGDKDAQLRILAENPNLGFKILSQERDRTDKENETARANFKIIGRTFKGVNDQATHTAARNFLINSGIGIDGDDIPELFGTGFRALAIRAGDEVEKFSKPFAGQTPEGTLAFFRQSSSGAVEQVAGVTPIPKAPKETAPTQLSKLIAERNALPPGDPNIPTFDAAIQKAALGSGFDIEFGEDGKVTSISLGTGRGKGASGNRQDTIQSQIDANTVALSTLDKVESAIKEDPTRAGVAGGIRSLTQRVAGAFVDVVKLVGFDIAGTGLAKELAKKFDPNLPEIDIAENSLAYALARTRKPTGKLNKQDFDNAKKDINLKGATSSQEALARIEVIRGLFDKSQKNLQNRRGGERRKSSRRQQTKTRLRFDAQGNRIQ